MKLNAIQTGNAPAAIGPYSQGISAAPWVFVSGQLGMNPETGDLVGDKLAEQARQALENMKQILAAGGCSLENVVSVDVFLTDMSKFVEFNSIYESFFSNHRPARAVIQVSALPKNGCVEVKCIAIRSE